ncbi:hypothetical protein Tco_0713536 [Tanacetum coccineum]
MLMLKNKCVVPANDENLKYDEMEQRYIDEYSRCVKLEAKLSKKKDMVEKAIYNELSNRCSRLEKRCISLEIKVQQSKESFHNDRPCKNQDALEFPEFFVINELKAQLQKKNTTIGNLKDHIATLKVKSMPDCTLPVNNSKVISLWMYKLDLQPLSPKHRKNMEVNVDYLKQTKEHADILHDIVEQARAFQPLDNSLDYACKFTTCIQELFIYVSATCPSSLDKSEILVVFKPMNTSRKVTFTEPSTSTRVKSSTSTSGSKPSGNSKKNKISSDFHYNWKCPLTRITSTTIVPPKKPVPAKVVKKPPPRRNNLGKPKATTSVIQIVLWYLDSGCSKHMTGQLSQLINFVSKFMGTVRFRNDQGVTIMG